MHRESLLSQLVEYICYTGVPHHRILHPRPLETSSYCKIATVHPLSRAIGLATQPMKPPGPSRRFESVPEHDIHLLRLWDFNRCNRATAGDAMGSVETVDVCWEGDEPVGTKPGVSLGVRGGWRPGEELNIFWFSS
jgi:hypothetical protein